MRSYRSPPFKWGLSLTVVALAGCSHTTGTTFHQKCGWKAEDYFDDPKVVARCRAIEANDIKEVDRLVAAGADINAKGKDNMTPLLTGSPQGVTALGLPQTRTCAH